MSYQDLSHSDKNYVGSHICASFRRSNSNSERDERPMCVEGSAQAKPSTVNKFES
ncbi:unnamed protein product [Arabis nemorensis]|uniref:Uncharacterized protein n=1 Tax=Arabis nemorensis TaxID=586526 RepID=A0A565BQR7_9BRAS|nr:unnamed protein product [Arabis nemorensis]